MFLLIAHDFMLLHTCIEGREAVFLSLHDKIYVLI